MFDLNGVLPLTGNPAGASTPSSTLTVGQWNSLGTKSRRSRRQVCHSWSVPGDS